MNSQPRRRWPVGTFASGISLALLLIGLGIALARQTLTAGVVNPSTVAARPETYLYLTQWGSYGSGNGQFYDLSGVAVDSGGNVYVADSYNHRIQKFTSAGGYLTQWGTPGPGDGQFQYPE